MASKENPSLTDFIKKIVKATERISKRTGVTPHEAGEKLQKKIATATENQAKQKEIRDKAVKRTENLRSRDRSRVVMAEREIAAEAYDPKTLAEAQLLYRQAQTTAGIRGDAPQWLTTKVPTIVYSETATELAANICWLPRELRDDPRVLYEVIRRADASLNYQSANEAITEYANIRAVVVKRITELLVEPVNEGHRALMDGFEEDGVFGETFDLYHEPLPEVSQTRKKPQEKDYKGNKAVYKKDLEEWINNEQPSLQARNLRNDLRNQQKYFLDDRGRPEQELERLKDLRKRLESGSADRSKNIEGFEIYSSEYDQIDAEYYRQRVLRRYRVVESRIAEAKKKTDLQRSGLRPGAETQPSLATRVSSGWIFDKDENGAPIVPADYVDPATGEQISMQPLREILASADSHGAGQRLDDLNADYMNLLMLSDPRQDNPLPPELVHRYARKIEHGFKVMSAESSHLTPEIIERINNPITRDEVFFEMLRPVSENPTQSSRELISLWQQQKLEGFFSVVSQTQFSDEALMEMHRNGIDPNDVRQQLRQHYTSLKESLVANHDVDFYTRGASGDIKSFKTAVHYFQNSYFMEAVRDPVIETFMQCNEQALKIIMNNGDGYIPPQAVSYDEKTYQNEWDRLTWQLFKQKVQAGTVFDYKRNAWGAGVIDSTGLRFEKSETALNWDQLEKQRSRMMASLQIAKGTGLVTQRTLEIFAKSKTPGYDNRTYGTQELFFSSKGYEGIARWFNPMADFFGKYKMGVIEHKAFFGVLLGLEKSDLENFIKMDPTEWQKVARASADGRLDEWIEKKYGKKHRKSLLNALPSFGIFKKGGHEHEEHVERMLDSVDKFFFSGISGPLSGWREHDATIGFTDLDREKEGGSMRLFKAKTRAYEQVIKPWEDSWLRANVPGYDGLPPSEQENVRITNSNKMTAAWAEMLKDPRMKEDYDKRIKDQFLAYRTMVWVQLAQRSPTLIAPHIEVSDQTYVVRGEAMPKNLRAVVLEGMLADDGITREILAEMRGGTVDTVDPGYLRLDMIRDVRTEKSPDAYHKKLQARIGMLEGDVMAVQQKVLYGGPDGRPRDIREEDFDIITGNFDIVVDNRKVGTVDTTTRRRQAKEYFEAVRKAMLGERSADQWMSDLGVAMQPDGSLRINNAANIGSILHHAETAGARLTHKLVTREVSSHMGLEDMQWGELDWAALGERHLARRGNDLEARANTIVAMVKYLDTVRGLHPDEREMIKGLIEIWTAEKEHDPMEGEKFVWLWAYATAKMYQESAVGKIPFAGRILPKLGLPVSVMQTIYGADSGASWSANNIHKFIHEVVNATHMAAQEQMPDGTVHPYNAHHLEQGTGATKKTAIIETLLIGSAIAIGTTAAAGFATGVKKEASDDSGSHHG